MSKPWTRWLLQAKYGAGLVLFVFDIGLLLLLVVDIFRIERLGLDYAVLSWSSDLTRGFATETFLNFLVLLLLPIVLSVMINFLMFRIARGVYYRRAKGSPSRVATLLFHFFVVVVCVVHITQADGFQRASGMCGPLAAGIPCFETMFRMIENSRNYYLLATIFLPLFGVLLKDVIYRERELAKDFEFWRLVGSVGEYRPAYGDEIIYVNSASMAPSINLVNKVTSEYHDEYQRAVPTSSRARRFLTTKADDARRLLLDYILGNDDTTKKVLSVEFFPGTSRALEAGLLRVGGVSHVILSQYEHPSQVDVIRWLSSTRNDITFKALYPHSPEFFQETWENQKAEVVRSINEELRGRDGDCIAVVLSEVHYITGLRIPVKAVMSELRKVHESLVFIIDGSQAVGSLTDPFRSFVTDLATEDFYYFSAHKWLLSPNTCGVLISSIKDPSKKTQPYDMFGLALPTSTIDPNTIFGLAAALEFLFDDRGLFQRFREMSVRGKDYFRTRVEDRRSKLELVDCATTELNASLFMAVRPKSGFAWKDKLGRFWEEMRDRGVDLTVVPEAEPHFSSRSELRDESEVERYILRISFPYFLLGEQIRALLGHLNKQIERVN